MIISIVLLGTLWWVGVIRAMAITTDAEDVAKFSTRHVAVNVQQYSLLYLDISDKGHTPLKYR